MSIPKPSVVPDPQIESLFKKIFTRAQPTEHRYFTAAPTTTDLQVGEIALYDDGTNRRIYANVNGTVRYVALT